MKNFILCISLTCSLLFSSCGVSTNTKTNLIKANDTSTCQSRQNKGFKFPKAIGYINDFDNLIPQGDQKSQLNNFCLDFDQNAFVEIVVATIDSIEPYTSIDDYSIDLFNEWEIGTKEKNNGILITVFKRLHKARITTGLGSEKILTNKICDDIMNNQMIPFFKTDHYYLGLRAGIKEIEKRWKEGENK